MLVVSYEGEGAGNERAEDPPRDRLDSERGRGRQTPLDRSWLWWYEGSYSIFEHATALSVPIFLPKRNTPLGATQTRGPPSQTLSRTALLSAFVTTTQIEVRPLLSFSLLWWPIATMSLWTPR